MKKTLFFLIALAFALTSCELLNPTPAYIGTWESISTIEAFGKTATTTTLITISEGTYNTQVTITANNSVYSKSYSKGTISGTDKKLTITPTHTSIDNSVWVAVTAENGIPVEFDYTFKNNTLTLTDSKTSTSMILTKK